MPPHSLAAPVRRVVVPFDSTVLPGPLLRLGHGDVFARWCAADRTPHAPRLVAVPGEDGASWAGAALVTARQGTAYVKIVDAVGDVPAAVAAVVAYAREQRLVQVKWEGWTATAEQAAAAGFVPLRPPHALPDDTEGPAAGYVRWLVDQEVTEPPYYGQTTHFTCGAVTALVARAQAGAVRPEALDRAAELTLWRGATNFPACEPVGLGVAVRRAWPTTPVTVHLDTDRPVMLDSYAEAEQEWRAVLQRASRTEAAGAGVPVDPRGLSAPDLRAALARGEHVLLLVSLAVMQGFDVPHWVLCHGAVPGALVLMDSWRHTAAGETWVDAHLLPVPDRSLDAMSLIAPTGFRGAVRLGDGPAA